MVSIPLAHRVAPINIMAKELAPVVISCVVWGSIINRKKVEFLCDNRSLVEAITKGSSKDTTVMHLLRCLWFLTASSDIHITASHLPGVQNSAADLLSRNQLKQFFILHPQACRVPTPIPPHLTQVVSPRQLDWTSLEFLRHFNQITHTPQ